MLAEIRTGSVPVRCRVQSDNRCADRRFDMCRPRVGRACGHCLTHSWLWNPGNRRLSAGNGALILTRQTTKKGRSIIVYDDALVSEIDESFFDPVRWSGATTADGLGSGRGKVLFIECDGQQWALRHYCRGGLARQLSTDRFVWTGLYRTRPFREWSLLEHLHHSALPVPRPVAARVIRHGAVYTADLITVRLPDVRTLSACLSATTLSAEIWRSVGQTIARFHSAGVCHADLNAHNIQIDRPEPDIPARLRSRPDHECTRSLDAGKPRSSASIVDKITDPGGDPVQ